VIRSPPTERPLNARVGDRHRQTTVNTAANHIASILAKLHLENRIQAAVQAVRSGVS
jgi:DNA-binding CsgD family transcriptional regulator